MNTKKVQHLCRGTIFRTLSKASFIVLLFSALIILPAEVFSQNSEQNDEEYSRWSMSLFGGYTYAERGEGIRVFASRFNVVSEPSYNFGAGIDYALTPYWSIEGGYRYSPVEGVGFNTSIHTASLRNKIHLNRLMIRREIAQIIDPYLIVGLEHDFFQVETPDESFSRNESSLIGGIGVAFRLSNRIELFGQHEIKLSSNRIDNVDRGFPYDQIGMSSGGIRIHFNKQNQKPLNLKTPTRQITDSDYDSFVTKANELESERLRLSEKREKIDELERELAESERDRSTMADQILSLEAYSDSLNRVLEDCICGDELEEKLPRTTVEAGHYVQVFATRDFSRAEIVKERFISLMSQHLDNPEEKVFIISRKQFYEVMIGTFDRFADTQPILRIARDERSDSFVITFPRPLHLQEQYQGTSIIHENTSRKLLVSPIRN
ncbi:MAG: hypothetical protein EA390_01515 [Balneolaceae bacterium]|nr:MAG: hypothetical protein EA390_01515 [Balneolaceae bacterium]